MSITSISLPRHETAFSLRRVECRSSVLSKVRTHPAENDDPLVISEPRLKESGWGCLFTRSCVFDWSMDFPILKFRYKGGKVACLLALASVVGMVGRS